MENDRSTYKMKENDRRRKGEKERGEGKEGRRKGERDSVREMEKGVQQKRK